ncbi:MAG: PASTA domain-containing protein [Firmicutes bacterium]|nr:PASTA domain-containing protein [[Eubacterium] siraeum]MCM1489027.1 PASTA domain-containing protein [Bacillota bacterium]
MKKETNLCMNCMGELNDHGTCPLCGLYDADSYISSYLAPKTFLNNRYIVGRLISYCGESALYIGFDVADKRKVTIREYMPDTLCTRERDQEEVTVKPDKMPLYKTYLAEFAELQTTLMHSPNIQAIQPVLDVFAGNNTCYAVMEYIGGISLKSYLANCGEILPWEQVKELFPPILTALNQLHKLGIIHRGISTTTILVSEKNQLILTGFSITAAHTADSDIGYEVFGGYAPPEQYSSSRRNGSWTDVYGIAAVMYRCLTGVTPPTAPERLEEETLIEPMLINRNIPKNASEVIVKGMQLEAEDRIQSISEFVDRFFEQPSLSVSAELSREIPVSPARYRPKNAENSHKEEPRRTNPRPDAKKSSNTAKKRTNSKKGKNKAEKDKIKFIVIASFLGAIILAFIIAMAVTASGGSSGSIYTEATTTAPVTTVYVPAVITTEAEAAPVSNSSGESYIVPNFSGAMYDTVTSGNQYSYLIFNPTYDFSNEFKEGQIISQTIEDGTSVSFGTEIGVTVCKGPESKPLPDYIGYTADEYVKILAEQGIKYRIETEETDETAEGLVSRCSHEIGQDVYVAQNEEVVVYSAIAPKITTTEATLPPETPPYIGDPGSPDNPDNPDDPYGDPYNENDPGYISPIEGFQTEDIGY